MTLQEVLSRLDVKNGSNGQYMARCPCHNDRQASLSVGIGGDGRVLLHCHAGCDTADIMASLGLTMRDLFVDLKPSDVFPVYDTPTGETVAHFEAEYIYPGGGLKKVKMRKADGGKFAYWMHSDNGQWLKGRNGAEPGLYATESPLPADVYLVEGEKDVDTMKVLGCAAASLPDGAKSKWRPGYGATLNGRRIIIIQDNDTPGKDFAQRVAGELHGLAQSVKVLDLSMVWPEIPEHGDVSDMVAAFGADKAAEKLVELEQQTQVWKPAVASDKKSILSCFKTLDDFQEEEASWLVPGWIPEGQITLMAADGGVGKTTIWCDVIAALSNGTSCLLDPQGFTRKPEKVVFLTTEDSVRKKLRKKLRLMSANMQNIITPDFVGDKSGMLHKLKFGSSELEEALRYFKPIFCTFDPVQGFVPPNINMGSRNEMRDCMAPLISLGEEIGTTSLVICHTNKRKGAFGRDRIADSADLWDIARSVMMAGFTEEQGIRYLTNEKNNYTELQETILFSIDKDGQIHKEGTSWKRDKEYIQDADIAKSAPKREDTKGFIMKTLGDAGGIMATSELEDMAKRAGYSFSAVKRAKQDLKKENTVRYYSIGGGKSKVWYIQLLPTAPIDTEFIELPLDTPTPF